MGPAGIGASGIRSPIPQQHFDENDEDMKRIVGEENFKMLIKRRKDFIQSSITFRVNAISGLIERQEKLQKILQTLQIASTNELFMKALLQKIPIDALFNMIMDLIGVNLNEFLPQGLDKKFSDIAKSNEEGERLRKESAQPGESPGEIASRAADIAKTASEVSKPNGR